ncbi:MAG: hydroxymethylbilane synthase [Gammaproteobacteria bacterium]|nr:hydroxymethylbilane synthase [Gammaproteobacteria bacterium]
MFVTARRSIRIATRGSRLARWQATHVKDRLLALYPTLAIELVIIKTLGDRMLDTPLAKIGGKGLFIKELEQALLEGEAEVAVHSMKDVPVELPMSLHIPVLLTRDDPRDCLLAPRAGQLRALPANAIIGTSSLRRRSQLNATRADLDLRDLRGNVTTRLSKLTNGDFDGIVLAAAGLRRLGLAHYITEYFATTEMLPAIGQGIIGLECRVDDMALNALLAPLNDPETADALAAERALNATLQGGCQVPIAGHAVVSGDTVQLDGLVASLDGQTQVRAAQSGPRHLAEALGHAVGETLRARGADRILAAVTASVTP